MTHYPFTIEDAMRVTEQEAWIKREDGIEVIVPPYIRELVEMVAVQARKSSYVDQSSGVSVRMTIALLEENIISNAERRSRTGERRQAVRVCDLQHALSSITGKVVVYEGEQEGAVAVAKHLIGKAVKEIFTKYFPDAYKAKEKGEGRFRLRSDLPLVRPGQEGRDLGREPRREFHKRLAQVNGLEVRRSEYLPMRDPAECRPGWSSCSKRCQNSILAKERTDTAALAYTDMFYSDAREAGEADD